MTLDEAIERAEEVVEMRKTLSEESKLQGCSRYAIRCGKSAEEHRQLAEWLKELKTLKAEPCDDAISREAALEAILTRVPDFCDGDEGGNLVGRNETASYIRNLPSVTPKQKTGKWIEIAQYSDGMHKIACSECKTHIFDRGRANSIIVKNKYKYCPSCGAKMEVVDGN